MPELGIFRLTNHGKVSINIFVSILGKIVPILINNNIILVHRKGEKIQLVGFGTFEVSERAARTGRNPQTGEEMTIPASKAPKFKAGKALKDLMNE